jgi:hypothetical protein
MLLSGPEDFFIGSYATFVYLSIITFYWTPIFQDKLDIKSRSLNILMYLFQWVPFFGNIGLAVFKLSHLDQEEPKGQTSNVDLKRNAKSKQKEQDSSKNIQEEEKIAPKSESDEISESKKEDVAELDGDQENEDPEKGSNIDEDLDNSPEKEYLSKIEKFHENRCYRYRVLERIGRRLHKQGAAPEEVYSLILEFSNSDRFEDMDVEDLEEIATQARNTKFKQIKSELKNS